VFKRHRRHRSCPRCQRRLISHQRLWLCTRCLLIWHGDTFEPLTPDSLGVASLYDYFFRS
jgi:ribosomal protein L37AE/L43A